MITDRLVDALDLLRRTLEHYGVPLPVDEVRDDDSRAHVKRAIHWLRFTEQWMQEAAVTGVHVDTDAQHAIEAALADVEAALRTVH